MLIKIAIIVGTRPELIKLAPIIKLIEKDTELSLLFIHTGQHYDYNMSDIFIKTLNLPEPKINIGISSGSYNYQIGKLLIEIEKVLLKYLPDVVIAQGDTNTVVASALSCQKCNICFIHLEAGLRSFDKNMPEEVNRILTGACSMYHLVPTERAALNLLFEGIDRKSIFIVGNTIVDIVFQIKDIAESKSNILEKLKLSYNLPIVLITLHRPANVDYKESLESFLNTIINLKDFQFIFPIHHRTKKNLKEFNLYEKLDKTPHILLIDPLNYLDFLKLLSHSLCILTDSGGVQEESSILKIPCITVRNNTERPETIESNSNVLVGSNMDKLKNELFKIKSNSTYLRGISDQNPLGDGKSAEKIIKIIKRLYKENLLKIKESKLWQEIPKRVLKEVGENNAGKTVRAYEILTKKRIQIIFDKNGQAHFPSEDRILKKDDSVIIINSLEI